VLGNFWTYTEDQTSQLSILVKKHGLEVLPPIYVCTNSVEELESNKLLNKRIPCDFLEGKIVVFEKVIIGDPVYSRSRYSSKDFIAFWVSMMIGQLIFESRYQRLLITLGRLRPARKLLEKMIVASAKRYSEKYFARHYLPILSTPFR